jgi:hypothetical protein
VKRARDEEADRIQAVAVSFQRRRASAGAPRLEP